MKNSNPLTRLSHASAAAIKQINALPPIPRNKAIKSADQFPKTWQYDAAVLDVHTVRSGRYWLTALLDQNTRKILNTSVCSHRPESSDVVEFVKKTINSHGTPDLLACDNGVEFHNPDFLNAMSALGITLQYSPTACHYKGRIERFFQQVEREIESRKPTPHQPDKK